MIKIPWRLLFVILLSMMTARSIGQNPFYSESLIKYSLDSQKTDKPIPFDHAFTLIVDSLSPDGIDRAVVFETEYKKGVIRFVENNFKDCNGQQTKREILDIRISTDPKSNNLRMFFPPLKPNKGFEVFIVYKLRNQKREDLLDINSLTTANDIKAGDAYDAFFKSLTDKLFNQSVFSLKYPGYQAFYASTLAPIYANIVDGNKFDSNGSLSEKEIQATDISTSEASYDFKDAAKLMELGKRQLWVQLQQGLIDINKIISSGADVLTTLPYGHVRLKNLKSNIAFFDSVLLRIDRVISTGNNSTFFPNGVVVHNELRHHIAQIRNNLIKNYSFLDSQMAKVIAAIDSDKRIRSGYYLSANTQSNDLKTAGGNVLFIDAGFTNILAHGVNNKVVYIPKLYTGISIYFRAIDKNTRRNRFHSSFTPEENDGCRLNYEYNDDKSIAKTTNEYGPDYGIVSKWSIWQHLSLNIGITFGAMTKSDFDNFYNGNSLLVGPAYRFARAFKFSTGFAFMNRTSKNPIISEKQVVAGKYVSLSVDIDFIQAIKDVTTNFFK